MRRVLAALLLSCLLVAPAEANGFVRGTIWPTRADARRADAARERAPKPEHHGFFAFFSSHGADARAAEATPGLPKLAPQPGVLDAVISVREIPEKEEEKLAKQAQRDRTRPLPRVTIQKSQYHPRVMAVAAGTGLEFQNLDRIWHSAFSVSSASRFDLGKLKPGVIETVKLPRPGVINIHCDIHPDEVGFVVITPNHAFTRPDSLGRFTLPKLPPGDYQIEIWHPLRGDHVAQVVVPKHGDATCDLAF